MRAAILGADGQLGRALTARYPHAIPLRRVDVDIGDRESVEALDWSRLDTILNAAAYTNVDQAETETGRRRAWQVNAMGPRNLAQAAVRHGLTLIHFSSDYVFDGTADCHRETEPMSPLGVYGQSKAAGDIAVSLAPDHYVLRLSWLVGDGANFVRSIGHSASRGDSVSVVGDQIGRLTFTDQIVDAVDHLLSTRPAPGTYNCSNEGAPASWAHVARAVFIAHGRSPDQVKVVDSQDYYRSRPGAASRPRHSTLDLEKIEGSGLMPRDWRTVLEEYFRRDHS